MLNNFKKEEEEIDYGKDKSELYLTVRKAPRSKIQLDDGVMKKSKSKGEISGRKKASSKDDSSSKATNSRRNKNEQSKTTSSKKSSMADESLKSHEVRNYLKFFKYSLYSILKQFLLLLFKERRG